METSHLNRAFNGLVNASNYEEAHHACQDYCAYMGYRHYIFLQVRLDRKVNPPATIMTNEYFKQASLFTTNSYRKQEHLLTESGKRITPFFVVRHRSGKREYIDITHQQFSPAQQKRFTVTGICTPLHTRYQKLEFTYFHTPHSKDFLPPSDGALHSKFFTMQLCDKLEQLNTNRNQQPITCLSEKENRCLYLLAEGRSYREIAQDIGLSQHSIAFYMNKIIKKLRAKNRCHAVSLAIANDYAPPKL